jgi:hypothetical protein
VEAVQAWLAGEGQSQEAGMYNTKTTELQGVVQPIIKRIQKEIADKKKEEAAL